MILIHACYIHEKEELTERREIRNANCLHFTNDFIESSKSDEMLIDSCIIIINITTTTDGINE